MEKGFQNFGNYDIVKDIQILTPTKKGDIGTRNLNKELQKVLNPKDRIKKEKEFGEIIFREGDKVMQTKNNYDTYWESIDGKMFGSGVFNGDLGIITRIKEDGIEVVFDDEKKVLYEFSNLEELEHAYAITIHKSQGSEFPVVLMPIVKGPPMLLTRNLLYTAITRAKKMLVVIGNETVIQYMVKNQNTKERNTGLKYKLNKYVEIFKES